MRSSFLIATLTLTGLAGCVRGPVVAARYEVPAAVPLRSFPRVLVTSGHDALEVTLAQELVAHLQSDVDVWRIDRDRLEGMRLAGELRAATLVVLIELRTEEGVEVQTTSRPETVCGPTGCYRRTRYDSYDVPTLRGTATLTVYEGPTARMLQRVDRSARERGRSWEQMRGRLLERLLVDVRALVDPHEEVVRVRLLPVDLPGVETALATLAAGEWREGRRQLENAAGTPEAESLSPAQRARLLYDLGIARRFDAGSAEDDPDQHFADAEAALRQAIELDPEARYAEALASLREHRSANREIARQREATERNFALERQADPHVVAPPPPPGYEALPAAP